MRKILKIIGRIFHYIGLVLSFGFPHDYSKENEEEIKITKKGWIAIAVCLIIIIALVIRDILNR